MFLDEMVPYIDMLCVPVVLFSSTICNRSTVICTDGKGSVDWQFNFVKIFVSQKVTYLFCDELDIVSKSL